MKKNGKYRFTLQFGADVEEQIRAGEFLEKLGNRKSAVIVAALNEYLASHPELQDAPHRIEVKFTAGYSRSEIEQMIRAIVEERMADPRPLSSPDDFPTEQSTDGLEADVAQMLDNLDVFG